MISSLINLYKETFNFFRNQFNDLIVLIILITLIKIILEYILFPNTEQLTILKNIPEIKIKQITEILSEDQKNILLKTAIADTITNLINNVLLISGLSATIKLKYDNKPIDLYKIINLSLPIIPKLLLLIFIITLLIQLGFILMIIPGIILATLLSLAPWIIIKNNTIIIKSLYISMKLAFNNINLIAPAVVIWFTGKIVITLFTVNFTNPSILGIKFLSNGLHNLISTVLLIYLYNLYSKIQKITK